MKQFFFKKKTTNWKPLNTFKRKKAKGQVEEVNEEKQE
jgi:hypothetical protein